MRDTYLESHHKDLPVMLFNTVHPTQANCFLIHILLSIGEFENQMKLMDNGDIKEAYKQAVLFDKLQLLH